MRSDVNVQRYLLSKIMSLARSGPSKSSSNSTIIPSFPALPKLPFCLQRKCIPTTSKEELNIQESRNVVELSSFRSQNELDDTVGNLSTIVKRSEQLLTPIKQPRMSTNVRRTASLHLTKAELDRRKPSSPIIKSSNSHSNITKKKVDDRSKLHNSISDRSNEYSITICSSIPRRSSIRSFHNVEKYTGIRCALPSLTSTIPNTFKRLEKHNSPMKTKQPNVTSSLIESQITPANTKRKEKSPWRLRFEKFLNHEEPTPLSSSTESTDYNKALIPSLGKENRTPSFRVSTRRTSKLNVAS